MRHSTTESKPDTTPFLMFYTSDWIAATWRYTFEQRGFYAAVLFQMWEMKSGLPDDCRWLATALGCDPRTAKRLRDFLIAEKKLESRDGFLSNRRMMRMIARALRQKTVVPPTQADDFRADFQPTSAGSSTEDRPDVGPDLFQNANEINEGSDLILYSTFHIPEEEDLPSSSINPKRTADDGSVSCDDELFTKLTDAAGPALVPESTALARITVPKRWLAEGCDLERDVLPAIRVVASRRPPRSVRSWSYFSAEVLATRKVNTDPIPEIALRRSPIAEQRQKRLQKLAALCGIEPREVAA